MKISKKIYKNLTIALSVVVILLLIFILTYFIDSCDFIYAINTQKMANIFTSVSAIALAVTVFLNLEHLKHSHSQKYFERFNDKLQYISNYTGMYSFKVDQLINYPWFVHRQITNLGYEDINLRKDIDENTNVDLYNKNAYDIMYNLTQFKTVLNIRNNRFKSLIEDILNQNKLNKDDQNILLEKIINRELSVYVFHCRGLNKNLDEKTKRIDKENFYVPPLKGTGEEKNQLFYDDKFLELYNYIEENILSKKRKYKK